MEGKVPGWGVRHVQTAVMSVCAATLYISRSCMAGAVLAMTDTGGNNPEVYVWSEQTRGVILSSFFWGYTVLQVPAGVLARRRGGKPLLLAALVLNGLLCLATPLLARIGDWMAVCAVRVLMGLSQACFMPSFHTILGQWAPPHERTRLSALSYAGIQIGTIVAMPLSGLLSRSFLGWKMIYYCMGTMTLVTSLLWWGLTASSPGEHTLISTDERNYIEKSLQTTGKESEESIPWRQILSCRPLYAICIAHIGCNWAFVFFLVEVPTYVKSGLGIDLSSSATLSALPFAAQWAVSLTSSVLCEHIYNRNILSLTNTRKLFNSIGCFGMAAGFLWMSFIEQKVLGVVVLTLTVGIFGSCCCGFMLNHIDLSPNLGGLMFSLTNCVSNLVAILVPLVTGLVLGDDASDISRWRVMFFLTGGLLVTADLLYRIFGSSELQTWNNYKPGEQNEEKNKEEKKYEFPQTKAVVV